MLLLGLLMVGCSEEDGLVDNREQQYGYVQFKLYKEASYEAAPMATRALKNQLDYLSEATKIKVTLSYGETTMAQTLNLTAADLEMAEYGLRSDKMKLLAGTYQVVTFMLYDNNDEPVYTGVPAQPTEVRVVAGGLEVCDLQANVVPRGKVRFHLVKDLSDFDGVRAGVERQYTFDEIKTISLTVQNKTTNERTRFERLPAKFSVHFDEESVGHQTSSLQCDTLLSLKAGDYRVVAYETYDESKILLESKGNPASSDFSLADNQTLDADVKVTLYESDEYIKDYYALKDIWEHLNGSTWYYTGENFQRGANWSFEGKDCDLWGNQPGVELHLNGRVARIDISDFGFSGRIPDSIGQLTELVELYLGTHNDANILPYDPSLSLDVSLTERQRNRLENHKKYLAMIHQPIPLSEPCARALAEHNIRIPATAIYDTLPESEVIDRKNGRDLTIRPMDTNHGTICNGLESISEQIGQLKKLTYFYLANSTIERLPEALADLESCTDLEIYNCPNMKEFPMVITRMPELVSLNLSNNAQWEPEEVFRGMKALADGPSKEKIQILYARQNRLPLIPNTFCQLKKIGLLDLAYNEIEGFEDDQPFGKEVSFVQLYLDNNKLTYLPKKDGYFCGYEDVETFSINYNKLRKVPNIFNAESNFTMTSVSFAGNEIDGFEDEETPGGYKGIKVQTFTLSQNPKLTKYPLALAKSNSLVSYLVLRGCSVNEIPKGSFEYRNSVDLMSLDLSYNNLKKIPQEFHAGNMPYFYGLDLSFNNFEEFPYEPLDCSGLTVLAVRSQRDETGARSLREWPAGIGNHRGLRGLYLGSNDLRVIDDTISTLIYYLDISDNPNIVFDASGICYAWRVGAYILIYDKTQEIIGCDYMLE